MTPMIDVVFLLVIFLLISTTFKKRQLVLEVNLPRASERDNQTVVGTEHQIRVDSQGRIFLCPNEQTAEGTDALDCTKQTQATDLVAAFKRLVKAHPGVRLGVYAGADVPYQQVVKIVAAATEAELDLNLPYQLETDE
jgi:biopolymer transport protein ExbD